MIDGFDIMAFVVLATLLCTTVLLIVVIGGLPGKIATQRNHPQAAAITAAGWLSLLTVGVLWPLALIWAYSRPVLAPVDGGRPAAMIAFMVIIYSLVVFLLFKFKIVKPRPAPVVVILAAGVLMIGAIVVMWLQASPVSNKAVVTRYVVQIVPYVKGQVTSIPAKPNVLLKKGDVLYEIDPTPYQYALRQVTAQLNAARNNVQQFDAGVRVAQAAIEKAKAGVASAKASLDVATSIQKMNPEAVAKLKMQEATDNYAAAQAGLQQAEASEGQATSALAAAKDSVVAAEAALESAKFNLQECTVRALTDGFVTDWQIREGTFVVPMPMAAAGTFIDTTELAVVATFPANMLLNVKPGQEVELAINSAPGRLFRGKVDSVIEASGEGQFTPGGKLGSAASIGSHGFLAVKIHLNDDEPIDEVPMGAAATVAIYTDWGKPFFIISKVTVRMQKWLYFLPIPW